jgi:hypothetical protein
MEKITVIINGNLNYLRRGFEQQYKNLDTFIQTTDITYNVADRMKSWAEPQYNDHLTAEMEGYVKGNQIIWDNMPEYNEEELREAKYRVGYTTYSEQTWEEIEDRQYTDSQVEERYLYDVENYFQDMYNNNQDRFNLLSAMMASEFYREYNITEDMTADVRKIEYTEHVNEWQEWLIKEATDRTNYNDLVELYYDAVEQYKTELMEYYEELIEDVRLSDVYGRNDIDDVIRSITEQMENQDDTMEYEIK